MQNNMPANGQEDERVLRVDSLLSCYCVIQSLALREPLPPIKPKDLPLPKNIR